MVASVVATPVLERLRSAPVDGVVRGATERAAYLDLDGFVVALTAPGVPLMPNGIAVERTTVGDGPVRATPGRISFRGGEVTWPAGAAWEPRLAPVAGTIRDRGAAIVAAAGSEPLGLGDVARAVRERDADAAARAAERLIGLGGGLTP